MGLYVQPVSFWLRCRHHRPGDGEVGELLVGGRLGLDHHGLRRLALECPTVDLEEAWERADEAAVAGQLEVLEPEGLAPFVETGAAEGGTQHQGEQRGGLQN